MRSFFFLPAFLLTSLAPACCGIGSGGHPIQFGKQENIVIYNSKTQTEIFIRNARFQTIEPDFAFIAPTPSAPKIYSVDPQVFTYIYSKDPTRTRTGTSEAVPASSVEVVQVINVAGYKATTLKATDAKALKQYLESHNYKTTPTTETWLKKYMDKNWYLTAFQVESLEKIAATGVIAMEFHTDRPFNPYYVPSDNRNPKAAGLELTYISDQYRHPEFPNREEQPDPEWQTSISSEEMIQLAAYLKPEGGHAPQLPDRAYALKYKDGKFPDDSREDIFFSEKPAFQADPESIPARLRYFKFEPEVTNPGALAISLIIIIVGTTAGLHFAFKKRRRT